MNKVINYCVFMMVSAAFIVINGCGGVADVEASNFNQSCSEDSDCVAVYSGDLCKECTAYNSAINREDLREFNSLRSICTTDFNECPLPKYTRYAMCIENKCQVGDEVEIDYDEIARLNQ